MRHMLSLALVGAIAVSLAGVAGAQDEVEIVEIKPGTKVLTTDDGGKIVEIRIGDEDGEGKKKIEKKIHRLKGKPGEVIILERDGGKKAEVRVECDGDGIGKAIEEALGGIDFEHLVPADVEERIERALGKLDVRINGERLELSDLADLDDLDIDIESLDLNDVVINGKGLEDMAFGMIPDVRLHLGDDHDEDDDEDDVCERCANCCGGKAKSKKKEGKKRHVLRLRRGDGEGPRELLFGKDHRFELHRKHAEAHQEARRHAAEALREARRRGAEARREARRRAHEHMRERHEHRDERRQGLREMRDRLRELHEQMEELEKELGRLRRRL